MFAFQHYLVKSYDSLNMGIDVNKHYLFSMITEDLIGVVNILLHSLLFLLMKKFESFGPFRIVKMDSQTNFLLFLSLYAFIDVIIFWKSDGRVSFINPCSILFIPNQMCFQIKIGSIILTITAMIFSLIKMSQLFQLLQLFICHFYLLH